MLLRSGPLARRARGCAWLLGLSTTLLAPSTWASGLDVPAIGSTNSSPTTADAAAIYWNPAMLGYLERGEFMGGVGVVGGQIAYERERLGVYSYEDSLQLRDPVDPEFIDPSKTGLAGTSNSPVFSPWADAFAGFVAVPDRLVLGLGFYVPYAAPLNFPADGAQRWQLQEAFIAVTRLTGSAAVKIHDVISIGAGVSYVFGLASLRRVQDFAAVDALADALAADPLNQDTDLGADAPSSLRESEVMSRPIAFTDGKSHGVSFNVGLAVRPVEKLTIGLTYDHGSRVKFNGDFTLDMNDPFFTQDLAAEGLEFPPLVEGTGQLSFRLAKRLMAGVAYDLNPNLRLDTSLAFVFWSDLDAFRFRLDSPDLAQPDLGIGSTTVVNLPRNWKNTVHAEISARVRIPKREKIRLSATLGYHSAASPDSTIDVASPDGHRLLGAFGFGYQVNERFGFMVDAELQGILPRRVTGSDFDLGNGTYRLLLASSSFHLQVRFGKKPGETRAGESRRPAEDEGAAPEAESEAEGEPEASPASPTSPASVPPPPSEGSVPPPPPPSAKATAQSRHAHAGAAGLLDSKFGGRRRASTLRSGLRGIE